jgi:hypothetical protein
VLPIDRDVEWPALHEAADYQPGMPIVEKRPITMQVGEGRGGSALMGAQAGAREGSGGVRAAEGGPARLWV